MDEVRYIYHIMDSFCLPFHAFFIFASFISLVKGKKSFADDISSSFFPKNSKSSNMSTNVTTPLRKPSPFIYSRKKFTM